MIRLCVLIAAFLAIAAPAPASAQSVMLLVSPKSGVKSVPDFVAWTKKSKKPLAYASSGASAQRFGEALAKQLGFQSVHVPYRAAVQGILDLIGGHIDFAVMDPGAAVGQIQGGLVLALAVSGNQRAPGFPDVPTFAEAGYPELAGVFPGGKLTAKTAYARH
jgi:tripartite-type tricarboxylate transporter receptor subunit TctC